MISLSLFMRCIDLLICGALIEALCYSMGMKLLRNWWPADRILKVDWKMSTLAS